MTEINAQDNGIWYTYCRICKKFLCVPDVEEGRDTLTDKIKQHANNGFECAKTLGPETVVNELNDSIQKWGSIQEFLDMGFVLDSFATESMVRQWSIGTDVGKFSHRLILKFARGKELLTIFSNVYRESVFYIFVLASASGCKVNDFYNHIAIQDLLRTFPNFEGEAPGIIYKIGEYKLELTYIKDARYWGKSNAAYITKNGEEMETTHTVAPKDGTFIKFVPLNN